MRRARLPDGRQVIRNVVEQAVLADRARHRCDRRRRAPPRRLRDLCPGGRARGDRAPHASASSSARRSRCSAPTTRSGCTSASRRSTRSRTVARRSRSAAARSPSRSRSSATTSPTTSDCSRRSSICVAAARTEQPVTWEGTVRSPLDEQQTSIRRPRSGIVPDLDRRRRRLTGVGRSRGALPASD